MDFALEFCFRRSRSCWCLCLRFFGDAGFFANRQLMAWMTLVRMSLINVAFSLIFLRAGLGRSEKPLTAGGTLEDWSDSTVGELDDDSMFRNCKWRQALRTCEPLFEPRVPYDEPLARGDQTAAVVPDPAEKSRFRSAFAVSRGEN